MCAIKISFNGAAINKPGAYSALKLSPLTGFPLTASGVVGIIGPSDGGAPGFNGPFTQDSIQSAKLTYKSGPIADAFDLLINPSGDERIVNGASAIYVYKTNQSTQSSFTLPTTWGTVTSKLYGLSANQIKMKLETSTSEVKPSFSFTYIAPAVDATYASRVNGGAVVSVSIVAADSASQAATKINGLTGLAASESSGVITVSVDATTNDGTGASLEVIDGAGTNPLTSIGISAGNIGVIKASTAELKKQYTLNHPDYEEEISDELGGEIVFEIGYVGTTATMNISDTQLTTTVAGGSGTNLTINFSSFNNLQEMVDYINAQTGYVCRTTYVSATVVVPTILDNVSSVGICSSASSLYAGRIKRDSNHLVSFINDNSNMITASETAKKSLPINFSWTYLTGGTLGSAANSNFQSGFDAFKNYRINSVIPLISQDGSTEGYGTYDWDSVAAQLVSHIKWGWSTIGKNERNGFMGKWDTKSNLIVASKNLNLGMISLAGQKVKRIDAEGNLVWMMPWAFASIAAGMDQGSPIGEPITYKYINVSGLDQDSSWTPKEDYAEMIDGGILFAEKVDSGGYRIVVGNTTYGKDSNFVWNRIGVVEAGGYVAYDLRTALENKFTGIKAAAGSATALSNFIKARMEDYLNAEIIVPDISAKLGYKNLSVIVNGNTAVINVTIYPVQGIDFILPTIYLDSAVQTA